jgi:ribosomal-protein-serine acetyltransferase
MMPGPLPKEISFSDGGITIRPVRLEDAEALFEAINETMPDLQQWLPFSSQNPGLQDIHVWLSEQTEEWAKGRSYAFAILDAQSETLIGGCQLNGLIAIHRLANVVYWVRSTERGHGVAGRAVRLLARFGFEDLGLQRLEILVAVENIASQKAAKKTGARYQGLQPNRILVGGSLYEAVLYSLIPADLV